MEIQKISKSNISDDVCAQIINLIKRGEWVSGDKLPSESELITKFGISRISIRSAMDKLRGQGIIITYQGRGSYVKSNAISILTEDFDSKFIIEKDAFLDIMELRTAIELTSIDLLIIRAEDEDFEKIYLALEDMRKNVNNITKFTESDYQFHFSIVKASKNKIFVDIYLQNEELFKRYLLMQNLRKEAQFDYSLTSHTQIYDSLKKRDGKEAIALIRKTFDRNLKRLFGNE